MDGRGLRLGVDDRGFMIGGGRFRFGGGWAGVVGGWYPKIGCRPDIELAGIL